MDKILEMIDTLQRSEFGDLVKLTRIRNRINDGYILHDDVDYVELTYNEFTNSRGGAIKKPSKAWYLLPICFWILGGVISYVCLRKRDPGRARNTLILGSVLSIIPLIMLVGVGLYLVDEYSVSYTDLSPEQIKQAALLVPYNSLMDDSDTYVGEIVRYEGKIVQVQEQFEIYALRVSTSFDGFASDDVIWVNYEPKTDEEKEWLEKLERDSNPFTEPNSENMVRVWGESKGLTEYSNIFGGTVTIPKIDGWIIEKFLLDEIKT